MGRKGRGAYAEAERPASFSLAGLWRQEAQAMAKRAAASGFSGLAAARLVAQLRASRQRTSEGLERAAP
ncbi:MAG: hypothetical protein CSA62_05200 [Planctomycetota bacterium]|nr:MAG: hypothetical protein CSA62_05200 [Planctomycetota bacterium]